jgi:hypothetical protein
VVNDLVLLTSYNVQKRQGHMTLPFDLVLRLQLIGKFFPAQFITTGNTGHSFGEFMGVAMTTMHTLRNKPATHPNIPPINPFQKAPTAAPSIPGPIIITNDRILILPLSDQLTLKRAELLCLSTF